ncbi:MAG: hypothetical protein NTZ09_07285 [Candidatus Hydrogenedentes bacterium]|nr:hypothetical protein [Candidatus Hydrogenedentota bacterium]
MLYPDRVAAPVFSSDVKCFPSFRNGKWKEFNLVLFGGPLTNSYTRNVLKDAHGLKCAFVRNKHAVRVPGLPPQETFYLKKPNGFVERDWGLFYRMKSPYARNRRVYVFAGCTTQGTAAAASCSLIDSLIPFLLKKNTASNRPKNGAFNEAAILVTRHMADDCVQRDIQVKYPRPSHVEHNPRALKTAKLRFLHYRALPEAPPLGELSFPEPALKELYASFDAFKTKMRGLITL